MKLVAIDTETVLIDNGLDSAGGSIRVRHAVPDLVTVTIAHMPIGTSPSRTITFKWDDSEIDAFDEFIINTTDTRFVMFNGAFDLAVLSKARPAIATHLQKLVKLGQVLDLRQLFMLRAPDYPTGFPTLADVVKRVLGVTLVKNDNVRLTFTRDRAPTLEQIEYAEKDAVYTLEAARVLMQTGMGLYRYPMGRPAPQQFVGSCGVKTTIDVQIEYSKADLFRAWNLETKGLATNRDFIAVQFADLSERTRTAEDALTAAGLFTLRRRPKAIVLDKGPATDVDAALTRTWTRRAGDTTQLWRKMKGAIQCVNANRTADTKELMRRFLLIDRQHNLETPGTSRGISIRRDHWQDHYTLLPADLMAYMDLQKYKRLLTGFIAPLQNSGAQRVYPRFWVNSTRTGRWSSSRPNAQNVPRKMRAIYCADVGCELVVADYPTLELYTLCEVMAATGIKGPLFRALEAGDIHRSTAAAMFDIPLSDITKDQRHAAKISNFALAGGMGIKKFLAHARRNGLDWDLDFARAIRDTWFKTYSDVAQYIRALRVDPYKLGHFGPRQLLEEWGFDPDDDWPTRFELQKAMNYGKIYTVRLPTGRRLPDRNFSQAANAPFQALGADVITVAFNLCCGADMDVRAVVHDSITVSSKKGHVETEGHKLCRFMERAFAMVCTRAPRIKVEAKASEQWQ